MNYIYKGLLKFCLWCEIPLKLLKVYIINVQDCSNARSFQKTTTVSTGLSDFHKMIVTVLKTNFTKQKPKEIIYRSYKNFENTAFRADLKRKIEEIENRNYVNFENVFIQTLENHAPLKKKIVRANHAPYMTKTLRKAIMRRFALENTFYKNNTIENNKAYKKHKNYCSRLYKKVIKQYYANLNHSNTDNRKFWKTIKPFLSD